MQKESLTWVHCLDLTTGDDQAVSETEPCNNLSQDPSTGLATDKGVTLIIKVHVYAQPSSTATSSSYQKYAGQSIDLGTDNFSIFISPTTLQHFECTSIKAPW